jgi:hypothetical protein
MKGHHGAEGPGWSTARSVKRASQVPVHIGDTAERLQVSLENLGVAQFVLDLELQALAGGTGFEFA